MEIIKENKKLERGVITFNKEYIKFRKYVIVVFRVGQDFHITVKNDNLSSKELVEFTTSEDYGFILMQIKRVYKYVFTNGTIQISQRFVVSSTYSTNSHLLLIVKHR